MVSKGYAYMRADMQKIKIEQLKGVGSVDIALASNQHAYVFIGSNGSGKTKLLEALFQCYLFSSSLIQQDGGTLVFSANVFVASSVSCAASSLNSLTLMNQFTRSGANISVQSVFNKQSATHNRPLVFIGAQQRGLIEYNGITKRGIPLLGDFETRRKSYFNNILSGMATTFSSLGMATDIETWFLQRATSANRFQSKKDERSVEIEAVLSLLHQISPAVEPSFLEVTGDGRVLIKINGIKTTFDHLSSGYSSVLKIFQCIIAGYGAQTNEADLCHIPGVVFLDEIESHLHVEWQAKIVPLLKQMFPNTLFYISTHSPLVLAQLKQGEAYKLMRTVDNGVVTGVEIESPNKSAFVDVIKEAFSIDINMLKRDGMSAEEQKDAKNALLKLLDD